MTARTDISTLVTGSELHLGARARIVLLEQPRHPHGGALAFKHYLPEQRSHVDAAALDALGDLPERAGPDAVWLRERTAWPLTLVTEGPDVVGFLMRAIPAEFHFSQTSSSGTAHIAAEFTYLLNEDRLLQDLGLLTSDRDRLLLLTDVADALQRLHRLDVRVGDLSPRNLVFAPSTHRAFFVGCDTMRLAGADVLPPVHTPGWELPEGEQPATRDADVYKFALLATRIIARNPFERDPSRLGHISPRLAALATATLGAVPGSRPSLDDWVTELRAAAYSASPVSPEETVNVAQVRTERAAEAAQPIPPMAPPAGAMPPQYQAPVAPPNVPHGPIAPNAPVYDSDLPPTVRASDIVGDPAAVVQIGPPGHPGYPGHPGHPGDPQNAPQRPSRALFVAGALVALIGGAAAAAFATGAFRNTTGTVAADTVTTTSHGNGAATSSAPHPTDPTDPTASGSGSPNPTDSPTPPPSPTDTTGTTASPTPAPTPTPAATSTVGTVTIDPSLVADPRAVPIATLFDTFFSAVNTKNFDAALALYDPSGDVNVSDPKQRASFKKSEATSTDDQGVLKTLSPGGTDPVTTAEVTFRSRQQAGYGPSDNPNQTCSVWTLTYTLSYTDGKYLIKGASGSHTGC